MPETGIPLLRHEDILTFDEITGFTKVAVSMGIRKVRLTGGEPLVRKGIVNLVKMIAAIKGINDLSMTTNGTLLKHFAGDLKKAGLHRVNISLDAVNPVRYAYITRGGNINDVLDGIRAAREAGIIPVKINCVVMESKNEEDAQEVAEFCKRNNLEIRYIPQMDLVQGHFSEVVGGTGGNCALCNRLRLTSNGKLRPCLFNNIEFDIRETGYDESVARAVEYKPECGSKNSTGAFFYLGG